MSDTVKFYKYLEFSNNALQKCNISSTSSFLRFEREKFQWVLIEILYGNYKSSMYGTYFIMFIIVIVSKFGGNSEKLWNILTDSSL